MIRPAAIFRRIAEYLLRHKLITLLLAGLAVYLPFLGKPFNIDDPFFLYAARAIDSAPLHPFSVPSYYDLWASNFNSIFFYYYPALLRLLTGESEAGMHAGYIVFFLGAGLVFYLLCRSMKMGSMVPALLLLFSPLSLLTATSIMGDFPFLFFLLAAFYCFARSTEGDGAPLMLAASLAAAGCAVLTKYYGVLLLLPLAYLAVARGKYRYLVYLGAMLACVLGVDLLFSRGREVHCMHVLRLLGWIHSPVRKETLSFLTTLGGVTVFPLSFLALVGKRWKWWGAYAAAFLFIEFVLSVIGWRTDVVIFTGLYLLNSGLLFALVAVRTREALAAKDHLTVAMGIWFGSYALFLMLFPSIMAARYVLPLLPPLLVFFCREANTRFAGGVRNWYVRGTLLLTLLLGVTLNVADLRLAELYRDFAREAEARLSPERTGFLGDYAFAYYLQRHGFKKYDPSRHELLLLAKYASSHAIFGGDAQLKDLYDRFTPEAILPRQGQVIRVWDPTAFAGFHLNMFGYIPWGLSRQPMESFFCMRRRPPQMVPIDKKLIAETGRNDI